MARKFLDRGKRPMLEKRHVPQLNDRHHFLCFLLVVVHSLAAELPMIGAMDGSAPSTASFFASKEL